ncbi:MAG TPA: TetR family transcriptional regulator, partial [Blastococcus sp.]
HPAGEVVIRAVPVGAETAEAAQPEAAPPAPTAAEPAMPEAVEPAMPEAVEPAMPEAVEPAMPEAVEPATLAMPEAVEPAMPEAVEPPQPAPSPAQKERRGARATGARARRYRETRARIVDAAAELFAERGFDAVSVMEIAQRAGVVEKTVFNHFPVKEGLVFDADPPMRTALLDAVRRRPPGESVSAAAGNFVVSAMGMLGSPEAAAGVAAMARVVRGSRILQIREREILGDLTDALAQLIVEETAARPGQIEPWLAAHAVLGLYASLLELARDRVLAGVEGPELAAELRRQGRRGLALLQFGLAGYAKKLSSSG